MAAKRKPDSEPPMTAKIKRVVKTFVDGVEVVPCPECKGAGGTTCHHCGHFDPYCPRCDGTGEVPKWAESQQGEP